MRTEEARAYILKKVKVRRQQVTIAQAYILKNFDSTADPHSRTLIDQLLNSMDAKMPEKVVLHDTVDAMPILDAVVNAISWKLAICEAIWNLIGCAKILPDSSDMFTEIPTIPWTTNVGGGGHSAGFSFSEFRICVPQHLSRARSYDPSTNQPLCNPDLYLKEIDVTDLHPEIEIALREAVRCFRHDLYLPCLAMLGRASEIAWTELGLALARVANSERLREQMEDPFIGIPRKIKAITDAYDKKDILDKIAKESRITQRDLRNCTVWADCVRESRNSLHYGVEPAMSNTYEKVAALLVGAVPHIKILVKITRVANSEKS